MPDAQNPKCQGPMGFFFLDIQFVLKKRQNLWVLSGLRWRSADFWRIYDGTIHRLEWNRLSCANVQQLEHKFCHNALNNSVIHVKKCRLFTFKPKNQTVFRSWRRVTPVGLLPGTEVEELWCMQASVALAESRPPRHQQSSGWTKLWVTEELQAESQKRLPLCRSYLGNQTDNHTVTSPLRWPGLAGAAPAGPLPPQLGCFWVAAAADSLPANPPVCVIALLPNIWWVLVMVIH